MTTVTSKATAKVAAVAAGLAMAASMLSLAPMAQAASLTSAQVQSILSLLSSFGADASTIANVQASLTGSTPVVTTPAATGAITKDLTVGSTGADVTTLQGALITKGYLSGSATGYFGSMTKAAVIKWQMAAGVTPASGYFGAKSRAAFGGSSTSTGGTTGTVSLGTGTGLKVMLSPTSPNGTVLVQGQGIGDLGDFVFSNPTASPINVTALTFNRIGVSNDQTLTNVYLYNMGTRLTDSAGVNSSAFTFSSPTGIFTVPAGQTYMVSVRSDIMDETSGQQIGVSLVSATSNGTLDSSVHFPIMGGYQTVSAAHLAMVSYGSPVTPGLGTQISPQNDYPIWQDTVSVSTNPVKLSSVRFTNLGSIDSVYVTNLRLYVDGVQAGAALPSMSADRTATFDVSAAPVMLSTQSHVIKVFANITGGASRTIRMSVQRSSDAMFVDNQLGQPVTPKNGSATFSAITAGDITINSVNASSGVSVSKDPSSPNQTIAVGASNQNWATFSMLASGENVKVTDLYVYGNSTVSSGHVGGLKNGKIMVNGVQVGSTKDIGKDVSAQTDFSFGSSLILPAGQTTMVSVYADAKDTASVNILDGVSVTMTLGAATANAQGQSSLNSANVPASLVVGNAVVVSASSLTATKYSGYGAQTIIAGANAAKLGAFTLSAGSTEGVLVNTINVTFAAAVSSTITNLTLKDSVTGTVLGSVITTPSTSNSYAVNLDVPMSSTKTIDIYGNILSSAGNGTIIASIGTGTTGTGDLTGTSATLGSSVDLQSISLGAGTLSVSRGAGDPVSNNVLAGASSVMVGEFNFAAQNSAYTVQNLAILVPNSAATSVTNVTVSYKDKLGATQTATQPLAVNAAKPFATATFTGLTMYVPTNDSANLDVYVGTPTVASGAVSGAAINVKLDAGNTGGITFRALNGAGSSLAIVNSGTDVASNGTFYVRKSIPTLASINPQPNNSKPVPATGQPLYKFSVTADPAGAIELSNINFNVNQAVASVSGLYLTDDASGNAINDGTVSVASSKAKFNLTTNTGTPTYQQVAAGQTKTYDLYGTVTGWSTGASLTISLASDNTATSTTAAATRISSNNNVVWSDRSATGHSLTSSDWTNGYLLKNFTSSAFSYSY